MRVGISVVCTVCGREKKPVGRSAPLEWSSGLCHDDCAGYPLAPRPGTLWPNETEEQFGYPVSHHGTREA